MCKKLALLIPLVLLVGPAQAATLFHWQFDGSAGQEIVSDTDIASSVVATRFTDDDGARDAAGLTYGPSNPWYNETGTCADFQNDANGNDYGYGFFVPDGGVGSAVDLSTLSALTIEAYVHPYQFRQAVIVRKYSGGGYDGVYFIDTRPGGQFAVRLGGPNGDIGDAGGVCNDLAYDINEWYHVALVWDGTVVKCYVDGVQSQDLGPAGLSEIPFTGPIGDSDRALGIGCIIRGPMTDAGSPPSTGQMYHGRIDEVRISDTALSPSQFIFPLAGKKASRPGPATRAESICPDNLVLHWTPGDDAGLTNGHDVYFGTDSDNVRNADTATVGIYKGRQDSNSYPESGTLTVDLGATYYWRVDEVNEAGTPDDIWPGSVWSFTVEDGNARDLDPPDGRRGVSPDVVLSWTSSCIATSHNVYLGTSLTDVTNGTGSTFQGSRTDPNYDPGGLDTFTTYYWRVDEVTSRGTFKGDVLTFRTGLGGLLMHFKFDGPLGNDLPEPITDFTGNVTFDHHYDPCDPGSMTYDEPNPFMNTGTSALFVHETGLYRLDPETGLYRLDPGPNTTDYVDILRLDGYQYTIEMWMRPYSFPDYDNNVLIKKYTPWSIEIDGGSQEIRFYHDGDDIESDDPTQAGEWYHVAAVFDQTDEDESQRLYINGVLNDDDDPTETNPADNNGPVAIGVMRRPSGS
ncbi:MAG: LamG-like jellyroll fold domain-containing protein, partial [Planctomycetota bacterium]